MHDYCIVLPILKWYLTSYAGELCHIILWIRCMISINIYIYYVIKEYHLELQKHLSPECLLLCSIYERSRLLEVLVCGVVAGVCHCSIYLIWNTYKHILEWDVLIVLVLSTFISYILVIKSFPEWVALLIIGTLTYWHGVHVCICKCACILIEGFNLLTIISAIIFDLMFRLNLPSFS